MHASAFENPIDIVSSSETWFTNVNESCYSNMLLEYKFFSKCRHNRIGGGVTSYVLDKYIVNILDLNISVITSEYLVVKITLNRVTCHIVVTL